MKQVAEPSSARHILITGFFLALFFEPEGRAKMFL
jgi:hypothetical protein